MEKLILDTSYYEIISNPSLLASKEPSSRRRIRSSKNKQKSRRVREEEKKPEEGEAQDPSECTSSRPCEEGSEPKRRRRARVSSLNAKRGRISDFDEKSDSPVDAPLDSTPPIPRVPISEISVTPPGASRSANSSPVVTRETNVQKTKSTSSVLRSRRFTTSAPTKGSQDISPKPRKYSEILADLENLSPEELIGVIREAKRIYFRNLGSEPNEHGVSPNNSGGLRKSSSSPDISGASPRVVAQIATVTDSPSSSALAPSSASTTSSTKTSPSTLRAWSKFGRSSDSGKTTPLQQQTNTSDDEDVEKESKLEYV